MQLLTADLPKNLLPVETRISNLEKILKPGTDSITLQIGTSKIVISQSGIELECQGMIRIRSNKIDVGSTGEVLLSSGMDMQIRTANNLMQRACGDTFVSAQRTLTLKGSYIQQVSV
jgi:hypothetical protein